MGQGGARGSSVLVCSDLWVPALQPVDVDLWSGVCDVCASFFPCCLSLFFSLVFCGRRGRSMSDANTYILINGGVPSIRDAL